MSVSSLTEIEERQTLVLRHVSDAEAYHAEWDRLVDDVLTAFERNLIDSSDMREATFMLLDLKRNPSVKWWATA